MNTSKMAKKISILLKNCLNCNFICIFYVYFRISKNQKLSNDKDNQIIAKNINSKFEKTLDFHNSALLLLPKCPS